MTDVVLVVDMVKGFCVPGGNLYTGESAREIIPTIRDLILDARADSDEIIFIYDSHEPDDLEFNMFPEHCVRGTSETDIIPELVHYATMAIPKQRYSGFYGTRLAQILKELKPENVVVCGVCTNICVLHTVADARNRDYNVIVYEDTVASFDEELHQQALNHMESILGATVVRKES